MRKIIFLFLVGIILFFNADVYAICDTADINRLKEIAKNVEITYEHNVYGSLDGEEGLISSVYDFTVSGLTDELYIIDDSGNRYDYSMLVDGVINFRTSSGKRTIYIYSENCLNVQLVTKTFNLPTFNFNSLRDECQKQEFKNLDICVEFLKDEQKEINVETFEEEIVRVEKEQQSNVYKIINFIKENILIAIGMVVVIILAIVFLFIRHHKRGVLE